MKNIKRKIKRALAAFLKEELLEYIGYNHEIPLTSIPDRFMINEIPFDSVVMEQVIPIEIDRMRMEGDARPFEEHIRRAKERFAKEVMKQIYVDAQNLTTDDNYMRRSVKFILRVQVVNKEAYTHQ